VAIQAVAGPVITHRGAWIGVPRRDLRVAQIDPGVEHRGDERVPQHVRVHAGDMDTRTRLQASQPAGGGVSIHPGATSVEQDRTRRAVIDRPVHRAPDRRRQRHEYHLAALTDTRNTRCPCSSPRSSMSTPVASKIRSPSRPSRHTNAKSNRFGDSRAADSMASNCRWLSPSIGDSGWP
jgi:hypothetical protein